MVGISCAWRRSVTLNQPYEACRRRTAASTSRHEQLNSQIEKIDCVVIRARTNYRIEKQQSFQLAFVL